MKPSKMSLTVLFLAVMVIAAWDANVATAQLVTEDLVSYWSFDADTVKGDTVEDAWGNNDGTMIGDPKIVEGKVGQALDLDGVDDYIEIPNDESLQFNENSVSMSVWIKPHGGEDNWIIYDGDGARSGYALVHDDRAGRDTFGVSFWNTGGTRVNFIGSGEHRHPTEEWHYVVGVLDGGKIKLYVNGAFEKETDFEGTIRANTQDSVHIGTYGFAGGYFIDGTIDELCIYGRALSDAEVLRNYMAKGLSVDPASKLSTLWSSLKTR